MSKLLSLASVLWPDVEFYDKQIEIIKSVEDNVETVCPAGNMLGKDFVTAFIVLGSFITNPVARIITTSVKDDHLRVLWGEIGRFIQSAKYSLDYKSGGLLIVNHREIKKVKKNGEVCPISYLRGMVSENEEGMAGHHAPYTLLAVDEASGVDESVYDQARTWSKRRLIIGNPNPCSNFFYKKVTKGSQKSKVPDGKDTYETKVIRIKAEDSPNVKLGLTRKARGDKIVPDEVVLPGVLPYYEYISRLDTWDEIRKCIGLSGEFFRGAEVMLFPTDWLDNAARLHEIGANKTKPVAMGVDPAEGGDKTCWSVVSPNGLVYQEAIQTPDTSVITGKTLALMRQFSLDPENVVFDRGGGGKEHADVIRTKGFNVRTVGFGEAANSDKFVRRPKSTRERREDTESSYVYKNRRAQMYHELRLLIDPSKATTPFCLPRKYEELRHQLSPIPLEYDGEGRIVLPPKNKPSKNSKVTTLVELIGHSPDEADSLVLAIFGMTHRMKALKVRSLV